jgi:hypothetical protein
MFLYQAEYVYNMSRRRITVAALEGPSQKVRPDNMRLRLLTLPRMKGRHRSYGVLPEPSGADLRDFGPIHVCTCGSQVFNVMASFEDYELVWYALDAECVSCGNLVVVPCPPDSPDFQA